MKKLFLFFALFLTSCNPVISQTALPSPKLVTPTEMNPILTPSAEDAFAGMTIDLAPLMGAIIDINYVPYLITQEGGLSKLGGNTGLGYDISEDGDEYVYSSSGGGSQADIYYCRKGESCLNLTKTPGQSEIYPELWAAEKKIIFISGEKPYFDLESDKPYFACAVDLDGNNNNKLWEIKNLFMLGYSLSPKGRTIAVSYEAGIYNLEEGFKSIHSVEYGLPELTLSDPSWSPDGKAIAWEYSGKLAESDEFVRGVVIINMEGKTSDIISTYRATPCPCDMPEGFLSWSPDGRWIAVLAYNEILDNGNEGKNHFIRAMKGGPASTLKIISMENKKEINIRNAYAPLVWSVNGNWLTYIDKTRPEQPSIIDLETSRTSKILNEGFTVIDWVLEN